MENPRLLSSKAMFHLSEGSFKEYMQQEFSQLLKRLLLFSGNDVGAGRLFMK